MKKTKFGIFCYKIGLLHNSKIRILHPLSWIVVPVVVYILIASILVPLFTRDTFIEILEESFSQIKIKIW